MKRSKRIFIMLLCFMCIFLTGCWDKIEIDRRVFISNIGIDIGKDIQDEKKIKSLNTGYTLTEKEMNKLKITFGFPDLAKIKQGEGTAEENTMSIDAYSFQDAICKVARKSSRMMYSGHAQLLILSAEILQYPDTVKEIIDYIQRHPSINRNLLVIVCDGKAEDYIKYKPFMEKNIENYITGVMENSEKNNFVLPITLNEFLTHLSESGDTVVPKIKYDKTQNEISLEGAAVIKNYKMIGQLNPKQVSDLELLKGRLKGGKRTIVYKEHLLDFFVDDVSRKIRFDKLDDKLLFNVDILIEGRIKGYYVDSDIFNESELREIEKEYNKAIKNNCEKFLSMTQKKIDSDLVDFGVYLRKYRPNLWDEIKEDWNDKYKDIAVTVNVKTSIRRIGVAK
ncbi:Ger(x)C family spore germination protein [Haloimpatiens sp. FM7330]|uniref:Ger(x)C family spore germination protein n=1 Tax=Haloimpatiens sp. FM7330 TaxID=3298610 RepID=UPI00363B71A6